jgi:hypothetical protein
MWILHNKFLIYIGRLVMAESEVKELWGSGHLKPDMKCIQNFHEEAFGEVASWKTMKVGG